MEYLEAGHKWEDFQSRTWRLVSSESILMDYLEVGLKWEDF